MAANVSDQLVSDSGRVQWRISIEQKLAGISSLKHWWKLDSVLRSATVESMLVIHQLILMPSI